jgi:hypothetical protein
MDIFHEYVFAVMRTNLKKEQICSEMHMMLENNRVGEVKINRSAINNTRI